MRIFRSSLTASRPATDSHLSPLTVISLRPILQYHSHPLAASLSPSTSNHPCPLDHPPLPARCSISDFKLERGLEMSGHNSQFESKPITNKQIVDALMPHTIEKITRVHAKGVHDVTYQVRRCPKGDFCTTVCKATKVRGRIEFEDGKGLANQSNTCCRAALATMWS